MTDEEIEDVVRQPMEEHLAVENRKAALDWLDTRTIYYAGREKAGLGVGNGPPVDAGGLG
jgi:hypothetical protein